MKRECRVGICHRRLRPGGNGQNVARLFIRLKDWEERDPNSGSAFAIIERATKAFNRIKEARVFASSPPAISGMGSSAGFDMELQDHAGAGHDALMDARDRLLELAAKEPTLTRVRHNGLDDSARSCRSISISAKRKRWGSPLMILTTHCKPPSGFQLRKRLYGSRSREEGLRTGSGKIPHAAG